MEPLVISFFENFKCLAQECPENCCKAWDMPVDELTYNNYKKETGFNGFKSRCMIKSNQNGEPVMRTLFGKCVCLGKDKLCKLQCQDKLTLMPKVCKIFPRYTVSYGGLEIGMLDMSCIQVARLLLKEPGRVNIIPSTKDIDIFWDAKQADSDFAEKLLADLENMLDYLWNEEGSLWKKEKVLFSHVYAEHLILVKGDIDGIEDAPVNEEYLHENYGGQLPWIIKERDKDIYDDLPFFPVSFINELIYQNLPDAYLVLYHPKMFKLINSYKRQFGKVLEHEADRAFMGTWKDLEDKYDWLEQSLKTYFSYKLQLCYLNASIDYYVIEPVLVAMLNIQFLMMFIITWCGDDKVLTREDFASLVSQNERLLSHNLEFTKAVMERIRNELL